jgi:hypothetical protein
VSCGSAAFAVVQVERHLLTDVKVLAAPRVGMSRGDSAARKGHRAMRVAEVDDARPSPLPAHSRPSRWIIPASCA